MDKSEYDITSIGLAYFIREVFGSFNKNHLGSDFQKNKIIKYTEEDYNNDVYLDIKNVDRISYARENKNSYMLANAYAYAILRYLLLQNDPEKYINDCLIDILNTEIEEMRIELNTPEDPNSIIISLSSGPITLTNEAQEILMVEQERRSIWEIPKRELAILIMDYEKNLAAIPAIAKDICDYVLTSLKV